MIAMSLQPSADLCPIGVVELTVQIRQMLLLESHLDLDEYFTHGQQRRCNCRRKNQEQTD